MSDERIDPVEVALHEVISYVRRFTTGPIVAAAVLCLRSRWVPRGTCAGQRCAR